ncbi:MAG: ABC transporter ATP-binding protein [Candidatus Heimdallarchaeota archaeon]|nr:ABC transporter ATP-binding protein [Candidatus Heimdallarchaeota archaeon]
MSNVSLSQDREYFSILWSYVKQDKINLFLVIFFIVINTALTILAPIYFNEALEIVEQVIKYQSTGLTLAIRDALILYFVLTLLAWFSNATTVRYSARLNGGVIKRLRSDTYASMISNKVEFFDKSDSGKLVNTITNDLNELYNTGMSLATVIISFGKLIAIIIILSTFSGILTITVVAILPIFFIITLFLRKYRMVYSRRWRMRFGEVNQSFAEKLRSIAISKAFNQEELIVKQFSELNNGTYEASKARGAMIFINRPVADLLRNLMLMVILLVGTWQVQAAGLSTARFYLFIFLLDYFYEPVRALNQSYNEFASLSANLERVLNIAYFSADRREHLGGYPIESLEGRIEFNNVTFSYDNKNPVLHNLHFQVAPGKRVAIVGHTGAGKSTIASLLMHFYDIDEGEIRLDGKPLKEYNLHDLRKNIAFVSQRILLFKGTIRENLSIAKPNVSDEEIWRAIKIVQAENFVQALPDGLDFYIEEEGRNLSVGQRQMLSFARAILSDPKLIILDEATSAVDLYTEAMIQQSTEAILRGRTSIVIAHRLTTIVRSDIIIVLEDGEIKEIGSHEELLQLNGIYKEMYDLYFQTQSAEYLETIKKK